MKKPSVSTSVLGMMILVISMNTAQAGKVKEAYFVKVDRATPGLIIAQNETQKIQPANKANAAGRATGKRQHKPVSLNKTVDKHSRDKKNKVAPGASPGPRMLVPAVQKARIPAAKPGKKGNVETEFKVEEGEKSKKGEKLMMPIYGG